MVRSLFFYALLLIPSLGWHPLALGQPVRGQSAPTGRPVLLDFSLPGCMPCREMDPVVSRLQQEGFDVRKVDGSRQPQVAQRFGVDAYPTFVLLSGGREVWRAQGVVAHDVLRTSLINATPAGVVPAAFNERPQAKNASFQVGGDLGPASPPPITPPNAFNTNQRPQSAAPGPAAGQLLAASVRLRVEDAQGHAFGTGTIIDAREGEALVLTCGHLFRGQGAQPSVSIELFEIAGGAPRVVDRAPGNVIAVDMENDVALVSLRPNRPVRVARVAGSLGAVTAGAPLWSVGCDLGADPTVRVSQAVGVNRTHRPPNVTSTGAPVQGRSGGGLFNAAGEVVGVCFGADEQANEGLYADLVSIHAQLDNLGLAEIYRVGAPVSSPPTAAMASAELTPVPPPIVRAQDTPPGFGLPNGQGFDVAALPTTERAALEEITSRAEEAEVICIVRPKTADGRSEVISLDRVSPAFLEALRAMPGPTR